MELLKDPRNNRVVKNVKPPPQNKLNLKMIKNGNKYNWELIQNYFLNEGSIDKEAAIDIIKNTSKILS